VPSTTFQNIKYDIWRHFAQGDEAVTGLPLPNTATGGSTTTAVCAALLRGTIATSAFNGRNVENLTNGDSSWVTDGGWDGTSTLTLSPAITAFANNNSFIIWPRGLSMTIVEEEINNVLRHTEGAALWIPSMVPDSDFDLSTTLADYWADTGSPTTTDFSTQVRAATTAPVTLLGEKAIRVVAAAADDGVVSDAFFVTEGEQLLVSVTASVTTDALTVDFYNVTGSASVDSVTIDQPAFTEVRFDYTVADNMEQGQIRFLGTAASSEFFISPPVVVQSYEGHAYAAPSWLTGESMVRHAVYLRQGFQSEAAESYTALSAGPRAAPTPEFIVRSRDLNPLHVQFRASRRGPLALVCTRPFAELSANTDTTNCDREYLVRKVVANIKKRRGEPKWRRYKDDSEGWGLGAMAASARARAMGYGEREMRIEANPVMVG
jgi:hypothetical protein